LRTKLFTIIMCLACLTFVISGCGTVGNNNNFPSPPNDNGPEGYGAEVNPTGEPLGGGEGYSKLVLSGDYTVSTNTQFLDALKKVKPGQVIYIEPQAQINLTAQVIGQSSVDIPAGITIAGNRGYNGSLGPLIYTDTLQTYPQLLRVTGPGVRITGIRLRGPSYNQPQSLGLNILADNAEVDNCEIYNWSYAGIHMMRANNVHIHHNYIHHVQQPGLGYPVALNRSTALIEANVFDVYRHAIAGTGHAGTGYEARYNLVKANEISHAFDMHGGTDYCTSSCSEQEKIMAGQYLHIHHNTFLQMNFASVVIRGVPTDYVKVYRNWFLHPSLSRGVSYRYYSGGNAYVYDNLYGSDKKLVESHITPGPITKL
jgi:hypothetical protein